MVDLKKFKKEWGQGSYDELLEISEERDCTIDAAYDIFFKRLMNKLRTGEYWQDKE